MIRPTMAADIIEFAPMLRDEDKQEIEALTGLDPLAAMTFGLFFGDEVVTGIADDDTIAMIAGVMPSGTADVGVVWMLCGDNMKKNARELLRDGRVWLDKQHERYKILTNVVDARYVDSRVFIKHMGFKLLDPIESYGPNGVKVYPFERY